MDRAWACPETWNLSDLFRRARTHTRWYNQQQGWACAVEAPPLCSAVADRLKSSVTSAGERTSALSRPT